MDIFKVTLPQLFIHVQALESRQTFPNCVVRLQGSCHNQYILLTRTVPVEQTTAIESKLTWQAVIYCFYINTTDLQTMMSSSEGVMYGERFQLEWRFIQQQTSFTASNQEDND